VGTLVGSSANPSAPTAGADPSGGTGGPTSCTISIDPTNGASGDGSAGAPLAQHVADASHNGYMSIAQAAALAALSTADAWKAARIAEMIAAAGAGVLTAFRETNLGQATFGGVGFASVTSNSNQEGGALLLAGSTDTAIGQTIFQKPKTGNWAVVFGVKMAAVVAGHINVIGIRDIPGTGFAGLITDAADDATHAVLQTKGTAGTGLRHTTVTTYVPDGTPINLMLVGKAGVVKAYVNNVLVATDATTPTMTDGPSSIELYATAQSELQAMRLLYGYVDPLPP